MKISAENSGDEQLAAEFHFWQLYYDFIDRPTIGNWVYYHLSRYGLCWKRPLAWWIFLFLFFTIVYGIIIFYFSEKETLKNLEDIIDKLLKLSLIASINIFSNPLDILKDLNITTLKISWSWQIFLIIFIFFFQKILQTFLIVQAGLAIRNQVKK